MQPIDPQRPDSGKLKQLQQPAQSAIRSGLRTAGVCVLVIGLVCVVIAAAELFGSGNEPPRHFWLGFIGLPLLFVGGVMCMYGFMGAAGRYLAGETAPVAVDTINYVAAGTKGAVETISKAAAKGVVEGIEAARSQSGEGKD